MDIMADQKELEELFFITASLKVSFQEQDYMAGDVLFQHVALIISAGNNNPISIMVTGKQLGTIIHLKIKDIG